MAGARRPTPRPPVAGGLTLEAAFLVERSPHADAELCVAWPDGRATGPMCVAPARWTLCLRYVRLGLFATVPLCEPHAREIPAERVPYLKRLVCYVCRAPATRAAVCGVCQQGEYSVCDGHQAPPCPNWCRPEPEPRRRAQLGDRAGRG